MILEATVIARLTTVISKQDGLKKETWRRGVANIPHPKKIWRLPARGESFTGFSTGILLFSNDKSNSWFRPLIFWQTGLMHTFSNFAPISLLIEGIFFMNYAWFFRSNVLRHVGVKNYATFVDEYGNEMGFLHFFVVKFKKNSNLIFPSISINFSQRAYHVDQRDIILWIIVEKCRSMRLSIAEAPQRVCQRLKLFYCSLIPY